MITSSHASWLNSSHVHNIGCVRMFIIILILKAWIERVGGCLNPVPEIFKDGHSFVWWIKILQFQQLIVLNKSCVSDVHLGGGQEGVSLW